MFTSRWNAPYGKDEQRSTGKNGGDTQAGSGTVGDEGYKTNETSEEGAQNYIDFYVEKAMAFGGLAHTSRGALNIRQWE